MGDRGLRLLFLAHGVITLAAAIVLVVDPRLIPSVAGINLERSAYLVAYLLAGAEFGFAVLSFGASRLADARAPADRAELHRLPRLVGDPGNLRFLAGRQPRPSRQCRSAADHRRLVPGVVTGEALIVFQRQSIALEQIKHRA
jgi:hypothetical protein